MTLIFFDPDSISECKMLKGKIVDLEMKVRLLHTRESSQGVSRSLRKSISQATSIQGIRGLKGKDFEKWGAQFLRQVLANCELFTATFKGS